MDWFGIRSVTGKSTASYIGKSLGKEFPGEILVELTEASQISCSSFWAALG